MITIKIAPAYRREKEYVINYTCGRFLGISYRVVVRNQQRDYEVVLENNHVLVLRDCFFSGLPESSSYANSQNIPSRVTYTSNRFLLEKNLPVIFGDSEELSVNSNKIICGVDIIASIFFMLSRWEEIAVKTRDKHDRFPSGLSLAGANGFLDRPIVNEYIEFLWGMLIFLGFEQKRKARRYELIPSHDIDLIRYRLNLKKLGGDLVKRRNVRAFARRLGYALGQENPYDNFDWLMDTSEKGGHVSKFFFMSGGTSKYDGNYSIEKVSNNGILSRILSRKHIVGLHASYHSYKNPELMRQERSRLESVLERELTEVRTHFLRFEVPTTWRTMASARLRLDSSLAYAETEGFRSGTGDSYPVFDTLRVSEMDIEECPLVVMDTTLHDYEQLKAESAFSILMKYIRIARKYNMKLTLLFHNSFFLELDDNGWKEMYESVLFG